jgi:hypothetical protein
MSKAGDLLEHINNPTEMNKASRVLQCIFEIERKRPMLTVAQLRESVNNRGKPPPHVAITKVTPLVGNKTLSVKAEAHGQKTYPMTITFFNVDYSLEKDGGHPLRVRPEIGSEAWMAPVSESTNPVQIRCNCPDYKYTYAWWNKEQKALSGRSFPPYVRKTRNLPERNPNHVPGTCKHLIGLFERLRKDKLLSG